MTLAVVYPLIDSVKLFMQTDGGIMCQEWCLGEESLCEPLDS